jgi:hypothetical protein
MEWSNEKTIEFVEDYRGFTCLCRSSDPDYKDRIKRRCPTVFSWKLEKLSPVAKYLRKIANLIAASTASRKKVFFLLISGPTKCSNSSKSADDI